MRRFEEFLLDGFSRKLAVDLSAVEYVLSNERSPDRCWISVGGHEWGIEASYAVVRDAVEKWKVAP